LTFPGNLAAVANIGQVYFQIKLGLRALAISFIIPRYSGAALKPVMCLQAVSATKRPQPKWRNTVV
jgi:hypothetical protein